MLAQSAPGASALPEIVGLAMSLFSIALSVIAMWLSIHFYKLSGDLTNRIAQAMSELMVSTRTTEVTTRQITSRALDVLAGQFARSVEEAEEEGRLGVAQSVGRVLRGAPPEERLEAQAAAARAVSDAFVKLRTGAAPTSPEYDWGPFVRRVDELQRSNTYLSVKWLHRKVFAGEPGMQEALQIALERGILRTFHRDNPRRASFPTLCCELDITDAIVVRTLRERLMPLRALDSERGRR